MSKHPTLDTALKGPPLRPLAPSPAETETDARLTTPAPAFTVDHEGEARRKLIGQIQAAAQDEDRFAAIALVDGEDDSRDEHADRARAYRMTLAFLDTDAVA